MKILFVIDSLSLGGSEKSLTSLLGFLAPEPGVEIDLMRVSPRGELEPLVPANVRKSEVEVFPKTGIYKYVSLASRALMSLDRKFRPRAKEAERFWRYMGPSVPKCRQEYDVAVAYHQGFPTYYVATKVKARRKVAWVNAHLDAVGYSPEFNGRFYRKFDCIVTASEPLSRLFAQTYGDERAKIVTVNDIISPKLLHELADSEPDPYDERSPLEILTVGRLEPVKGQDMAINAAKLLSDKGLTFRWHFIGGGSMRGMLNAQIQALGLEGKVILHGPKVNPYPWYNGCDLYVHPSRSEGYGIAPCEARVFGLPVVVTDFPVAPTVVTEGVDGVICPMSAEGIAEGVMKLADPQTRAQFRPSFTDVTRQTVGRVKNILGIV